MKTEILATIGPASIDQIHDLYKAGLSGVRINSSHSDFEFSSTVIERSRSANPNAYVVYDIRGPKIRIGDIPEPLALRADMSLVLRTDIPTPPDSEFPKVDNLDRGIPIGYELDKYVKPGHRLFVDDGFVGLKVCDVTKGRIYCKVLYGDLLRSRKGLNHPDTHVDYLYTMPYDIDHIEYAKKIKVDFIADSFTRNPEDVIELKNRLEGSNIKIISKIENPEGLHHFDSILQTTNAIMIARGDLGVEIEPWKVPTVQKDMIEKCNNHNVPVITATQMLESMIDNPRPNRADVSDIANALYDGTNVVMLSGETSIGKFPIKCVETMYKICDYIEQTDRYSHKTDNHGLIDLLS
jgi:pyruvate kinase